MPVIHITTAQELQDMQDDVTADYALDNDINLTGFNWSPIGTDAAHFIGSFDGQNHTISNLSLTVYPEWDQATSGSYPIDYIFWAYNDYPYEGRYVDPPPFWGPAGGVTFFQVWQNLGTFPLYVYEFGAQTGFYYINCNIIDPPAGAQIAGEYSGLFGAVGEYQGVTATISNITISNPIINSDFETGSIVAYADRVTMTNCHVINGTIQQQTQSGGYIGGMFGSMFGLPAYPSTITDCTVTGTAVLGTFDIGGFVGQSYSDYHDGSGTTFTNCTATNVSVTGIIGNVGYLGGFAGWSDYTTFINCSATGTIVIDPSVGGDSSSDLGGFIGAGAAYATKCYANVDISSGIADFIYTVGGFMGELDDGIYTNCYATGNITPNIDDPATPNQFETGGFAGMVMLSSYYSETKLQNCYASGNVTNFDIVGGFVGYLVVNDLTTPLFINCYSVGIVTAKTNAGGFIAVFDNLSEVVETNFSNCSWYTSSSTNAIADDGTGNPIATLLSVTYGTDEDTNTNFYVITHTVYHQGESDAWDFTTPVWYAHINRYPDFVFEALAEFAINFYYKSVLGTEQPVQLYSKEVGYLTTI